jgi:hypothetical protein
MATFRNHVPDELKGEWASIREAGELLATSRSSVNLLISSGQLETMKYLGNRTFVRRRSISQFLKSCVVTK